MKPYIKLYHDGEMFCATWDDYQTAGSPIAFGLTPAKAIQALFDSTGEDKVLAFSKGRQCTL